VDFLFRRDRFALQDIPYDDAGNLPLVADPKMLWAQRHPEWFPMDVNTASREALLRIPGIGPVAAQRIVVQRAAQRLRDLRDLAKLGAVARRAAPFVLIAGRRPRVDKQQLLPLGG
jgi:predicted DNA-binding helix-hairpin-helix protein